MAEESSARENPQQDVILIQEAVGDSLQGFRAVPPGASPTVDPINRNSASGVSALDGMNGGGITTTSRPHYVMMQDPPLLAPMGRGFSLDGRPNETSGFSVSGYGGSSGSFIQQQLISTQQMCLQQQNAMTALTETVKQLQQSLVVRHTPKLSKRKRDKGPTSIFSDVNNDCADPPSESNINSDMSDGNISSDESSSDEDEPVGKQQKLKNPEDAQSDKQQSPTETPKEATNKKIEKLKGLESKFKKEQNYAANVHDVVASTVNEGIEAVVDHKSDIVINMLKKHVRPGNCQYLDVPKVNKAVWASKHTRKPLLEADKLMQRTQRYLTQGLIPLVKLMDKTLKSESEESEEMFDLAMDSFNMFAFSHRDLSNQRRRLIAPAIAGKYKQLCSESAAISATQLFGSQETLEKSVKQIDESNKIGSKIHVNTQQKEKDRNYPSTSKSTGQRFSKGFQIFWTEQ